MAVFAVIELSEWQNSGLLTFKIHAFFFIQVSAQFISSFVLWSSREKVFQMEGTVKG